MNLPRHTPLAFGLSCIFGATALQAAPLALHPDNPHYFSWNGKPSILLTSGEHYGLLLNTAFDFNPYFDELAAHGLNHTRVFSGVYREVPGDFGITENPLAPEAGHFLAPWARSNQPGESDGGNKFDLNTWDPAYFTRLHDLLHAARQRDVVVEFNLFCPMYNDSMWKACPMNARNNINGIGKGGREEVYNLTQDDLTAVQAAFVTKVATELRDADNLYFEICNEPYFGGVTEAWQRRMIEVLLAADQKRHLISLNIANGRKKVVDPHPAVSIFNFHYCVPPDTVAQNYGLNKVIGENETGFRGKADVLYRTEAWDFLLAGGALYNNLDYSFTAKHPAGTLRDYQSPGGGSRELRSQLKILKDFLHCFDFVHMKTDPALVTSSAPALTASALTLPGKAAAIYLHTALPEKPKDLPSLLQKNRTAEIRLALPAATYTLTWHDPLTGSATKAPPVVHPGGDLALTTPAFDDDLALEIVTTER